MKARRNFRPPHSSLPKDPAGSFGLDVSAINDPATPLDLREEVNRERAGDGLCSAGRPRCNLDSFSKDWDLARLHSSRRAPARRTASQGT